MRRSTTIAPSCTRKKSLLIASVTRTYAPRLSNHTCHARDSPLSPVPAKWTVTLVLMKLVEHSIADQAQPSDHRLLSTHVSAFLQTVIIFLGSIARFFLNDLRAPEDRRRVSHRACSVFLGIVAYLGATTVWVLTTIDLLMHVGLPQDKTSDHAMEDAYVLWALAIVQVGYPVISLLQVIWLNCWSRDLKPGNAAQPMPSDQTDPLLSVLKDLGYGVLDSVCKGGLTLFVALRASR